MKVFVTGATGFIGTAVVQELLRKGHDVTGLARSEKSVEILKKLGVKAHRGSLEDIEALSEAAASSDGVIHLAFDNNSFDDFEKVLKTDQLAVETIGKALEGSGKPFVATSVTTLLTTDGVLATEDMKPMEGTPGYSRSYSENTVLSLSERGVRSAIVRLAPCVHDETNQGFATALSYLAREKGMSAYVNSGENHWPAIHRDDAAILFCLALESAPAGAILHGVGEEGIPFHDIAKSIGNKLHLPVKKISEEIAADHFGWLTTFVMFDNFVSSQKTQKLLNWDIQGSSLIADIENS